MSVVLDMILGRYALPVRGTMGIAANRTMLPSEVGLMVRGTGTINVTLPSTEDVPDGASFLIVAETDAAVTISRVGDDLITSGDLSLPSMTIIDGETLLIVNRKSFGDWVAAAGAAALIGSERLRWGRLTEVGFHNSPAVAAATVLNEMRYRGGDGVANLYGGFIRGKVGASPWSPSNLGTYLQLVSCPQGSAAMVEGLRVHGEALIKRQEAHNTVSSSATLTVANLQRGIVVKTGTNAVTLTLPTGTACEEITSDMNASTSIDWSVINNNATGAVTIDVNTGHTFVGNATVAVSSSAVFRTRKSSANTFVTYRIG